MNGDTLTRVRMELELPGTLPAPRLPDGFYWVPWDDRLLSLHAEVHFQAFADCIDRRLFSSFNDRAACWYLLNELRRAPSFLPEASWLIGHPTGCCATIQCSRDGHFGSVQNVGVLPRFRGRGLGEAILLQALWCFREQGLTAACLEVTAENTAACRLYERLGFVAKGQYARPTLEALAFG